MKIVFNFICNASCVWYCFRMFNATHHIAAAITAISAHAPESFTEHQVQLLERLSFEINIALQEREIAKRAQKETEEIEIAEPFLV